MRVFRDGGCQRSFCDRALADRMGLRVIEERVTMQIDGFNESKHYATKIVALPLQIAGQITEIKAVCLDNIRTNFCAKNVKDVARSFSQKGFQLADRWLINNTGDVITDIQVVLGSEDDDVLPMTPVLFGESARKSSYMETSAGIVLSGNIDRIMENLPFLPMRCNSSCNAIALNCVPFVCTKNINNLYSDTSMESSTKENNFDSNFVHDSLAKLNVNLDEVLNISEINNESETMSDINSKLVSQTLQNIARDDSGRLVVPLPWNPTNAHMLSQNFYLSKQILTATYAKLAKEPLKLSMYNEVFLEQEKMNIIKKLPDVHKFMEENPGCSFMPHMGVFRMGHDSTKCRIVFLSNLAEKRGGQGLSLNQVLYPGTCLNQKMATAVTLLRFDKFLVTFDLKKAFLMCALKPEDSEKLCFLWYNDIEAGDFRIVAYKTLRLPFGLRPSPTILMLSLYKILMLDQTGDSYKDSIKTALWNNLYMDNGSYTTNVKND